jgi:exonuclease VII small subunit
MSLIGELIARLNAVLNQTGSASASVHAARERLAQASGKVSEAATGSSSDLPREGLAMWQAADVKLEEALHCFKAGDEAMRGYPLTRATQPSSTEQ